MSLLSLIPESTYVRTNYVPDDSPEAARQVEALFSTEGPLQRDILVCQCIKTKTPRVAAYIAETNPDYKVLGVTKEIVLIEVPDGPAAVKKYFAHEYMHRAVARFSFVRYVVKTPERMKEFIEKDINLKDNSWRLVVYPFKELHPTADVCLVQDWTLKASGYTQCLNVVHCFNRYFCGFFGPDLFYSPATSMHSAKVDTCRAVFKLKESIQRSGLKYDLQPEHIAVDVGAAPGGMSDFLAKKVSKVYAVDPAEMKFTNPNLVHLKMVSTEAPVHIPETIDWLICDYNIPHCGAPRFIVGLEEKLKIGGYVIYTVKLNTTSPGQAAVRVRVFQEMFPNLKIIRVMPLVSNSQRESCIVAEKVAESPHHTPETLARYADFRPEEKKNHRGGRSKKQAKAGSSDAAEAFATAAAPPPSDN